MQEWKKLSQRTALPLCRVTVLASSFFFLISMAGCMSARIVYTPSASTHTTSGMRKGSVEVVTTDVRTCSDRVTYFAHHAGTEFPIRAERDVTTIIREAIEQELNNRGFDLATNGVLLKVELAQFAAYGSLSMWSGRVYGNLSMNATICTRKSAIPLFKRQIRVQGEVQSCLGLSGRMLASS